jgi:hypothetical protein
VGCDRFLIPCKANASQLVTGKISAKTLSVSGLTPFAQFSGQLSGFKTLDVPSMKVPPWRE